MGYAASSDCLSSFKSMGSGFKKACLAPMSNTYRFQKSSSIVAKPLLLPNPLNGSIFSLICLQNGRLVILKRITATVFGLRRCVEAVDLEVSGQSSLIDHEV